jgi:hypothetical protein
MTPLAAPGFSGGATGSGIVASGGTKTTVGKYTVHTFTSSENFVLSANPNNEDFSILLVAGGGNGSPGFAGMSGVSPHAGAGASSGAIIERTIKITAGTHLVTVGGATGSSSIGSLVSAPGGPGFNGANTPSYNKPVFPAIGYTSLIGVANNSFWIWAAFDGAVATPFVSTISGNSTSYGGVGGSPGNYNGVGTSNYGAGGSGGSAPSGSGGTGVQGIVYIRYRT